MSYLRVHGRFEVFMYQEESYPNIRILEIGERQQCKIQLPVDVDISSVRVVRYQSRVCSLAKVSSLVSLLSFLMAANTTVDDIPTLAYSLPGFSLTKPALTIKGEKSWKSASRPPSWKSVQVSKT